MYSTKEDLEPFDDDWPLFQRRRYFPGYRSLQRHIRFCAPRTSNALPLETTIAAEKEDTHDDNLCNWVFVSIRSLYLNALGCLHP